MLPAIFVISGVRLVIAGLVGLGSSFLAGVGFRSFWD